MAQATVETEDMTMVFTATMERNDYGVSGSPVWYEATDIELDSLEIMGYEVNLKALPKELVGDLVAEYGDTIEDWED